MNIAVYNGDAECLQQIKSVVSTLNAEYDEGLEYRSFSSSEAVLNSEWHFDTVILEAENAEGFKLAEALREADSRLIIIIVSSHSEYLDTAFELCAFRFLSKPLDEKRLAKAILSANRVIKNSAANIYIKNGNTYARVYFDDIVYIEIKNRHTIVTTLNSYIISDYNMTYWRKLLSNRNFATPHNSFLVNLEHITLYKRRQCVVLNNSYIIDISRTKYLTFDSEYKKYLKSTHKIA